MTQPRYTVGEQLNDRSECAVLGPGKNGQRAVLATFAGATARSDAQRVVACLNACEGVTTALLERDAGLRRRKRGRQAEYGWKVAPGDPTYVVPNRLELAVIDVMIAKHRDGLTPNAIGLYLTDVGIHPRGGPGCRWARTVIRDTLQRNE